MYTCLYQCFFASKIGDVVTSVKGDMGGTVNGIQQIFAGKIGGQMPVFNVKQMNIRRRKLFLHGCPGENDFVGIISKKTCRFNKNVRERKEYEDKNMKNCIGI